MVLIPWSRWWTNQMWMWTPSSLNCCQLRSSQENRQVCWLPHQACVWRGIAVGCMCIHHKYVMCAGACVTSSTLTLGFSWCCKCETCYTLHDSGVSTYWLLPINTTLSDLDFILRSQKHQMLEIKDLSLSLSKFSFNHIQTFCDCLRSRLDHLHTVFDFGMHLRKITDSWSNY